MSQVVAMLNYREMQILEISKTPFHTDFMLINIYNLSDAIDLAKRVLMKDKFDRQLTG